MTGGSPGKKNTKEQGGSKTKNKKDLKDLWTFESRNFSTPKNFRKHSKFKLKVFGE